MGFDELYLSNLTVIDRAISAVCRRHRLFHADAEDFASQVRLHLIDSDYAVLRRFEGRSSLLSYLIVVVTRLCQDWRNAHWGKWRASAEAKRLGPLAIRLERLLMRDGLSLDEACELLRTNLGIPETRQDLERLASRFPARHGRTHVSDEALENHSATGGPPDDALTHRDAQHAAQHAATILKRELARLEPQDQLIVRMRFSDGRSIADIARILHLEQKPLYRRIEGLLAGLRGRLERLGVTGKQIEEILGAGGFDGDEC